MSVFMDTQGIKGIKGKNLDPDDQWIEIYIDVFMAD